MLTKEEEIIELRKKGYGYRTIASILKIERDDVRGICKRHGLTGYGGQGEPKTSKQVKTKCSYCSKPLVEKERGRIAKFCCENCRRKWWQENQHKKVRKETAWYHFVCLKCGKEFKIYGNQNRKFCSVQCASDYRHGSYNSTAQDE